MPLLLKNPQVTAMNKPHGLSAEWLEENKELISKAYREHPATCDLVWPCADHTEKDIDMNVLKPSLFDWLWLFVTLGSFCLFTGWIMLAAI